MQNNHSNGSCASVARGFIALFAMLSIGPALMASSAEAAPFAYVANTGSNTVSVVDTATHPPSVVATVPVGVGPNAVAVTPDGKHVYVTNADGTVSVIRTAKNKVVARSRWGVCGRHHPGWETRLCSHGR
jgi:YVTN family beta-propeller protein